MRTLFRDFVLSRHAGDNPRGDFIRDFRDVPVDARSWDELESKLLVRHACREAIHEAEALWREYERMAALD